MGRIHANVRLIKIRVANDVIRLTVVLDSQPDEDQVDCMQVAATEIIADFPRFKITEEIIIAQNDQLTGHILEDGWIYRRFE